MASEQSTSYQPHEPSPLKTDKSIAELAEIVVFVDGRTETAGIFDFSGVLAQEHGAHLIAVFMQPGPVVSPSESARNGDRCPTSAATWVCTRTMRTWRWLPARILRARLPALLVSWRPSS
jgi:hypothetical protein